MNEENKSKNEELLDPAFCNYLLAQYEKNQAIEKSQNIDCLNTSEYQQFLSTFGNPAIQYYSNKIEQQERDLQLECDLKMIEVLNKPTGEIQLKRLHGFLSQKTFFDYVNAMRATEELNKLIKQTREENERLREEIKRLTQQ